MNVSYPGDMITAMILLLMMMESSFVSSAKQHIMSRNGDALSSTQLSRMPELEGNRISGRDIRGRLITSVCTPLKQVKYIWFQWTKYRLALRRSCASKPQRTINKKV